MNAEHIKYYATATLLEFAEYTADVFGGYVTLDSFRSAFDKQFTKYFGHPYKEKMSAQQVFEQGRISCSAATLVIGLWHLSTRQQDSNYYIDENTVQGNGMVRHQHKEEPKQYAKCTHTLLSHTIPESKKTTVWEMWKRDKDMHPDNYVYIRQAADIDETMLGLTHHVGGVCAYVANRISTYDLTKSERQRLRQRHHQLHTDRFINNESGLLQYLISTYGYKSLRDTSSENDMVY